MKDLAVEQKAYQVLNEVIDPELGIGIVDLGLIYDVIVLEDDIHVYMTLTTPSCPMGGILPEMVQDKLRTEFPDIVSNVKMVWEPAWNQAMITEKGRMFLGAR